MPNPIELPSPDGTPYKGPLLMFDTRVEHFELFAFVDGMREMYERFGGFVTNDRVQTKGHLILVCGPDRVGKSTFVQRCAYLLAKERGLTNTAVFHYGQARGHTQYTDFKDIALWLAQQMSVLLEDESWTVQEDVDKLRATTDDPNVAYGRIRDILDARDAVAIVILPQKLRLEWVQKFQEVARKRMVFFAESSDDDPETIARQFGTHPTCHTIFLSIGLLDGDGDDIHEILTVRNVGLDAEAMARIADLVRPFRTVGEALEELASFFDICGPDEITPAHFEIFREQMVKRLLARLRRD